MSEPSERAAYNEKYRVISVANEHYGHLSCVGDESCVMCRRLADLLTRYASAARLEEAEWWHAATNCTQSEAKEMNLRLLTLRAAQQKAPGETK